MYKNLQGIANLSTPVNGEKRSSALLKTFQCVFLLKNLSIIITHLQNSKGFPEAHQIKIPGPFAQAIALSFKSFQMEYYIRHTDGCPVYSEAEKQRVIQCLEAVIRRRTSEGMRLELCTNDRVGLLSEVTRIFRENGMSVTKAEVSTRGDKVADVFYVTDTAGNPVDAKTVEAVRQEIGLTILQVKDDCMHTKSPPGEPGIRFSLGDLFKSKSERFLYSLGLIKSYS